MGLAQNIEKRNCSDVLKFINLRQFIMYFVL